MTTKTAHEPLLKAVLKPEVALPFFTSVIIASPCTAMSIMFMHKHLSFSEPWLWMIGVLGVAAVCLVGTMVLEPVSRSIGRFTIPAMLGYVAIVLLYVLTETLNRYVTNLGYEWSFPLVIAAQGFCYCGIFFEKHLYLKGLLALSGLSLTVLWCLGAADKVALPF